MQTKGTVQILMNALLIMGVVSKSAPTQRVVTSVRAILDMTFTLTESLAQIAMNAN
jgi:hypothetical protein